MTVASICELGIFVALSYDCGQHLRIFIFEAICKNFVSGKFPAIQYITFRKDTQEIDPLHEILRAKPEVCHERIFLCLLS